MSFIQNIHLKKVNSNYALNSHAKEQQKKRFRLINEVNNIKAPWGGGGGALEYSLGGYVPPGTPNWNPVLKKISPKKWAKFLYPVLEFALKL